MLMKGPPKTVFRKHHRLLFFILSASLILKLTVWLIAQQGHSDLFGWADSHAYHETAVSLLRLGSFSATVDHPEIPQTYRTPGYPAFLALVYALLGESWSAAAFVQIFLSLLIIGLTYAIAARIWNEKIGLWAAGILALDPISFTYSLKVMTETLFTLLLVLFVLYGIRFLQSGGQPHWGLCSGLFLAAATSVRPLSSYLIYPAALGFLAWGLFQKRLAVKLLIAILLLILPSLIFVGAWKARNYRLTGSAIYTSIEGFYAYFWQGAAVIAARDHLSLEEAQRELGIGGGGRLERGQDYRLRHPETALMTFEQLSERWGKEGKEIIGNHPMLFARIYVGGILRMLTRPGVQQLMEMIGLGKGSESLSGFRQKPLLLIPLALSLLFLGLLYLGVFLALWLGWRTKTFSIEQLLIWGVTLYILALSGGPSAFSRFRIPMAPFWAMLCAAGYSYWRSRKSAGRAVSV